VVEAPKVPSAADRRAAGGCAAASELPSFEFEGGKAVETSSDPVQTLQNAI
jgi:hypothetical protein